MIKSKKNEYFSVSVELPAGREYQFRYLTDGTRWVNDAEADKYVLAIFGDAENSVLVI
ncbi:MAG: isoamylase early set domain-containing protein [Bacteroidota bacterium]